jgi:oligopeptide/dipeptide ABC transporter ATP-binding protein
MNGMNSNAMLSVRDLSVSFPGPRRGQVVKAVDGVSFTVGRGETFGVIGESGSGKSTVGRCLVCLLKPSNGELDHAGVDPFALSKSELRSHRQAYQIVFQDPNAALDPRMTILQSVCEPLGVARIGTPAERRQTALEMLERVALAPEMAERYPHELSGGQKQRANIARALVLRPKVIICDEVIAALDVSIQAEMLNLFMDLQRDLDLTYVFISHDLRVVGHISDRVAVMYFGKLVELGPTEALMEQPLHPYTQALLSAEPQPVPPGTIEKRRILLKGEVPSAINPPSGCRFHTRCPRAEGRCASESPALREMAPGHFTACHFAEEMQRAQ